MTFDTFLHKLNVTEEEHIKALKSSLKKAIIYLRQKAQDIYLNCYMKNVLPAGKQITTFSLSCVF